jgi:hypothetical protein
MFRSLPRRALVWATLPALLLAPNAFAATGDDAHKGEIAIESWSFNAAHSSGGGGGAGKVHYSDLSVMMSLEKASPLLQLAVVSGKHIPTMEVRSGDDRRQDYLTVTLEEVMVSSYATVGGKTKVTLRAATGSRGTGKTLAAEVMASSHPGGANFASGDGSVRF